MEWDRRNSAYLYHFLSGGQPVFKNNNISNEAIAPNGQKTHLQGNLSHKTHGKEMLYGEDTQTSSNPKEAQIHKDKQSWLGFVRICWEIIAFSNEGWLWIALCPVFLVLSFTYFSPDSVQKIKLLYAMLLVDIFACALIKFAIKRTRPHYNYGGLFLGPDIFSFPSGHSSRAMMLVHCSIFLFGWDGFWTNVVVVPWAALVAVSRLALGRHFVTDVMGGLLMGACEFWASYLLLAQLNYFALPQ